MEILSPFQSESNRPKSPANIFQDVQKRPLNLAITFQGEAEKTLNSAILLGFFSFSGNFGQPC